MSAGSNEPFRWRAGERPLRVLHVNASDVDGGAARAAHRLHLALRAIGADSRMLVVDRREPAPHVLQPQGAKQRAVHRLREFASSRLAALQRTPTNSTLHSLNLFPSGLGAWINRSDADVVNLHWLGGETLSVEEIGRIAKPICWTMHDMWPFCGAEHYDDLQNPGRYRSVYGRDNRPASYGGPDLDAWVWRRKKKAWSDRRFHLVSPSRWLADCAGNSALMSQQPRQVIPNCVDPAVFKMVDRRFARQVLNLDPDKHFVLFGAMASTADPRKGFHLLQSALATLSAHPSTPGHVELLVFGAHPPASPTPSGLPVHYLGNFHDEVSLALLYNAADVFVAPSMQDNLPNTVLEALACGTPCAVFGVGGMQDLVEHRRNGWVAAPFDPVDLAQGVLHLLSLGTRPPPTGFDATSTARVYEALYEQALLA